MKKIVNNGENTPSNENKKKFKFGRNPLTFIILISSIVVIFFIACIIRGLYLINVTYDVTPYKTNMTEDYKSQFTGVSAVFNDIEFYEYKDIKKNKAESDKTNGCYTNLYFDTYFYCKNYLFENDDEATFTVQVKWNANTKTYTKNYGLKYLSSSYNVYTTLCLAKDKVDFCKYAASIQKMKIGDTLSIATRSFTMTGLAGFPLVSKKTFPIYHSEKAPDAYLYFCFQSAGEDELKKICIHYTYDEYMINITNGAAK